MVGFDSGTGNAILQFRDQSSGQLQFQVPSRRALQYAEAEASANHAGTAAKKPDDEDKTGGVVV